MEIPSVEHIANVELREQREQREQQQQRDLGPGKLLLWDALASPTFEILDFTANLEEMESGLLSRLVGATSAASVVRSLQQMFSEYRPSEEFTTFSTIRWIHGVNQIEGEALRSIADTERVVKGLVAPQTYQDHRALLTLGLLNTTKSQRLRPLEQLQAITPASLQRWHGQIYKHGLSSVFRNHGAISPDDHVYPHHSIIPVAMQTLCDVIVLEAKKLQQASKEVMIKDLMALAAFAEFHIVDIHPFSLGNRRLGRFVAKYILDCVLPTLSPLYKNTKDYMESFQSTTVAVNAPRNLYLIFLREAHAHFARLASFTPPSVEHIFAAVNGDDLIQQMVGRTVPAETQERLKQTFREMKPNETSIEFEYQLIYLPQVGRNKSKVTFAMVQARSYGVY